MSANSIYPDIVSDVTSQQRTNFVGLVSYTVLLWDHLITFDDEVKYIWNQKKRPITYLFLLLRYFVPLSFIVNLWAYFSTVWNPVMCMHFVRYEGVMHAFCIYTVGLMMMLRIKALYPGQRWIPWFLACYVVIEASVTSYLLVHGIPVIHNPNSGVEACTMIFSETISDVASSSVAWLPLLYDTVVLALTLHRTIPFSRDRHAGALLKRIMRDGILYFVVIFGLAFTLTFMIIFAPAGVKNIIAQTEQLITVAMMSRITLNLKKEGMRSMAYNVNSRGIEVIPMSETGGDIGTTRGIGLGFGQGLKMFRTSAHRDHSIHTGMETGTGTGMGTILEDLVPEGQKVLRTNSSRFL